MSDVPASRIDPIAVLRGRSRWHWAEALPWIIAIAAFWVFPGYVILATQILIMILFALSVDLILGYAGIVTLGHAAFFGVGAYTTGMLSAHLGWGEPITGLLAGGAAAGIVGLISGYILLRYRGLALILLTLATSIMLFELANVAEHWTGGFDGLQGIVIDPLFGLFEYDLWGHTYYWYSLAVLFLVFLVARRIVNSAFGRGLVGIRENTDRMHAIGSPVHRRLVTIYVISTIMAGIAGALFAQSTAYVTLDVLSFARSGAVLIVVILGGTGRLYGAFIGSAVYMFVEDELSRLSPVFWEFGQGLVLVFVVLFFREGLLGAMDAIIDRLRGRKL